MKLIVALGNPGSKFKNTRHNAGVMILESWFKNQNFNDLENNKKLEAIISKNDDLIIAFPQTFMNESGNAVAKIAKQMNIKPNNILVLHDDADLFIGEYKMHFKRGSAGHKGVESIMDHLKSDDFWRLRIGIRPKTAGSRQKSEDFVLKKFGPNEIKIINNLVEEASESIQKWLMGINC
jgi:PTH1 family peptidyl-tRNA hydrolase